jgi:hypothetical protein
MPVLPTASENESDFIGRCMSEENASFPDEAQRYAVCKSKWDNSNMSKAAKMSTEERVASKLASIAIKYKGINLASDGLEDSCWPGYEAIGTKMLDGKEVPNCVPIKD